jgi:hypothetical protein
MPSEQHKPHDPAILIWVPVGETPTRHAFAARGASTFSFLPDAVIHAQKDAAHRPEKPWISTSNVMFGPDQISPDFPDAGFGTDHRRMGAALINVRPLLSRACLRTILWDLVPRWLSLDGGAHRVRSALAPR